MKTNLDDLDDLDFKEFLRLSDNEDFLGLKWGTIKAYVINDSKILDLVDSYEEGGYFHSNNELKEILCKIIDSVNCSNITIFNHDKFKVSKQEAKDYVMNYIPCSE